MADISRRRFLRGDFSGSRSAPRPPWARAEAAFAAACTRCRDCVNACPQRILVLDGAGRPTVDFGRGECTFCGKCVEACTPRALERREGAPPWQRRAHALQTLVVGAGERIEVLLLAERSGPTALALAFDYAGIPATAAGWNRAARALRALTGAQSSYTDEGWLGLWGERAVLGLYEADPAIDHLPRRRAASTYRSLWVRDLEGALEVALRAGAELPVVPAINTRAGIDHNPGYRQVYLSDSEGNGLVLTEYTGRPSM